MNKSKIVKYLLIAVLVIFAIIQLYPLLWLAFFSLKNNKEIFGENIMGLPRNWLWENYVDAFNQGQVGIFFKNSVIVTGVSIIFSNILAAMAAYGITRLRWKLSKPVFIFFLIGLMIPLHATLIPLFIILKKINVYNSLLALIIPYVAFSLPLSILVLTSFLQSIPKELEEAALIDGCNIYTTFIKIILPILKPAIATITILTFIANWNELMYAITFIESKELRTLTVGLKFMVGQYTTNWGPIGAGLMIATLPSLVLYIIMSSKVQKSITTGAIKG